jgi:hypothetical protein
MPRYLTELDLGLITEDEIAAAAARADERKGDDFPDIEWEHSHVVEGDGTVKTFCIYNAPNTDRLRELAAQMGHEMSRCFEIAGDIAPEDVKL